MPSPKPAARSRKIVEHKVVKAVAVPSKQKPDKRRFPIEQSQSRPSGTPSGPRRSLPLSTPRRRKSQPSPIASKLSGALTKLTKAESPNFTTKPRQPRLSDSQILLKNSSSKVIEEKKHAPGHVKSHVTESTKGEEQKSKKRKAVGAPATHVVKRVKHDSSSISSSEKVGKSLPSLKTKNKKSGTPAIKTKPKTLRQEVTYTEKLDSTLQETLARLPLLKAKSPQPKQKAVARKKLPVPKPPLKATVTQKKKVNFPHSKAALKRAHQILAHKSKPKKTVLASRRKVTKKAENKINVKGLKIKDSNLSLKLYVPPNLEPVSNINFWQPSVTLKKLEAKVTSSNVQDNVSLLHIQPAIGSLTTVISGKEKVAKKKNDIVLQNPNNEENTTSGEMTDHTIKEKTKITAEIVKGKLKKNINDNLSEQSSKRDSQLQVPTRTPQQVSIEDKETRNKADTPTSRKRRSTPNSHKVSFKENTENKDEMIAFEENLAQVTPNLPLKQRSRRSSRSSVTEDAAINLSPIQNSPATQKVTGESKLMGTEPEKQKQDVTKKPLSRGLPLKKTDDKLPTATGEKINNISASEGADVSSNVHHINIDKEESLNKGETVWLTRAKKKTVDKILKSTMSQQINSENDSVINQNNDTLKRKRKHLDPVQSATGKRKKSLKKDVDHVKTLNSEGTDTKAKKITQVPKNKKNEMEKLNAVLKKTKEQFENEEKQNQDIHVKAIGAENSSKDQRSKGAVSVFNAVGEHITERNVEQQLRSDLSDNVESPFTEMDSNGSAYVVSKQSNPMEDGHEDPSFTDRLKGLDPSFIEEANLSELLNSDSSCDNMSWNSLNMIANQRRAENLHKHVIALKRNITLLTETVARKTTLFKEISSQMKDFLLKRVAVTRPEKV